MQDEINYSQKNKRELNQFVGLELLFDYLSKNLDSERTVAIDLLAKNSKEIQEELHNIKKAINYTEALANTNLSNLIIEEIRTPNSYLQGFFQKIKWSEWPSGLKLGIEVFLVAIGIVSIVIIVPWHKVVKLKYKQSSDIILAEVQKDLKSSLKGEFEVKENQTTPAELTYQDETTEDKAPAPIAAKDSKKEQQQEKQLPPIAKTNTEKVAVAQTQEKQQGFLYRGTISVANLEVTSQKFVEKITELGGRKAGEVNLGWKKGEGTYFHFTVPESKFNQLSQYLNEYGQLKIQKEKHERVMSEGIIRIIITVNEDTKKAHINETNH